MKNLIDKKELAEIERKLHYVFKNKALLCQAFTHSSFAQVENVADNERMEFLGDAILDFVVSAYLYDNFSQCDEGKLSSMRSKIVSAEGLRPITDKLGVLQHLRVSSGVEKSSKPKKLEANLYEAILCAIYLDGGMRSAKQFVLNTLKESLQQADSHIKDSKTLLQEYCQKNKRSLAYKLVKRTGPDNKPNFKYAVYVDGRIEEVGEGPSKKSAEQEAARKTVTKWRIE